MTNEQILYMVLLFSICGVIEPRAGWMGLGFFSFLKIWGLA